MNFSSSVKNLVNSSGLLGSYFSGIKGFRILLGRSYFDQLEILRRELFDFSNANIWLRIDSCLKVATRTKFYKALYSDVYVANYRRPDFSNLPIVTKELLRGCPIGDRAIRRLTSLNANTGGTTGQPLNFRLDRKALALEWAHIHGIWSQLGFEPGASKLTLRGLNLGNRPIVYRNIHNEYVINCYLPWNAVFQELRKILTRKDIFFLHGYPSLVAEFCYQLEAIDPFLRDLLQKSLKGILLGSEYPLPIFRDAIESCFTAPTLSWYGHSEMACLATEKLGVKGRYYVLPSYGLAEAIPSEDGEYRLISTSFINTVSPFIRYDTGDLITEPEFHEGFLQSFTISSGRSGDFVCDRKGQKISLTALIHGRHHEAFGYLRSVQVYQIHHGEIQVLVVPKADLDLSVGDILKVFDFSNLDMSTKVSIIPSPVRTANGKQPLLVPNNLLDEHYPDLAKQGLAN